MREITSLIMQPFYLAPAMAYSVMTLILLLLPMPKGRVWHEYRKGYPYILAAFLVMLVLTGMHSITPPPESGASNLIVLMIAFYQAILFGMGMVKILQPQSRTKIFVIHLVVVGMATVAVIPVFLFGQQLLKDIFFWTYIAAYVGLIVYYTRVWSALWKRVVTQVDSYYDEDMKSRLKWLKRLMIAVMAVGVMALVTSIWISLTPIFVSTYTICYAYFLACIIRFTMTGDFLLKAVDDQTFAAPLQTDLPSEDTPKSTEQNAVQEQMQMMARESQLKLALDEWVATKQYADTERGVDEIARELGTNYAALRQYFQRHQGTTFRSWRTDLRLEEAKRLLVEEPNLSLNDIMDMVGFNDRGNFYRHFQKKVGCSPSAYRQGKR
ncbi:MAG: helix-turn-helix domain-containing protein [Bacteroidaceae bacterium]|nr:helix-turn-helix domain-containing protein [Bacteroidaceae bacterium]